MRTVRAALLGLYAFVLLGTGAFADTLYVGIPTATASGHPLRLANDRRAAQPGDLVAVQFDFSLNASSSAINSNKKDFNLGAQPGSGLLGIGFLRFPTSLAGASGTDKSHVRNDTNQFTTAMMATVTDVLPSGNLVIGGDQKLIVNGVAQTLHVVGTIRPEDIDSSDTILSSRVANVQAEFKGDTPANDRGILKKIVNALF